MPIEIEVMELLKYFLDQDKIDKMESKNGRVKIYNVGENFVRIDIRRDKPTKEF